MEILDKLQTATKAALWAVDNGQSVHRELEHLEPLWSELEDLLTVLNKRPNPVEATKQFCLNKKQEREAQPFILSWRGGGSEQITGWEALAKRLCLGESSIHTYLSNGRGEFCVKRTNPLTGEIDVVSVCRVLLHGQPEKPKIGRPRKHFPIPEQDAQPNIYDNYTPKKPKTPQK